MGTIIGLSTAAIGGVLVVCGIWFAIQGMVRANTWKPVQARVMSATVESHVDSDQDRMFFAVYKLEYDAGGQRVESALRSNPQSSSEAEIRTRMQSHPPGGTGTIFFNPAKPTEISPTAGSDRYAVPLGFVAMGLLFAIVGSLIWYGSQPSDW